MSEIEKLQKGFEKKMELVLTNLAKLGIANGEGIEIDVDEEDEMFLEVFNSIQVVAENMKYVMEERNIKISELEESVETIQKQSVAIQELSTPVIQVWEEVLILPLIGTIDTARAQQIIENLLDTINKTQSLVAIIDITGVPVVDTRVANHFLKTIKAARMLGTEVILTGVSPHNAQTLVKLGVELSQIVTKGSLKAGLKLAFELTKNKVLKGE